MLFVKKISFNLTLLSQWELSDLIAFAVIVKFIDHNGTEVISQTFIIASLLHERITGTNFKGEVGC